MSEHVPSSATARPSKSRSRIDRLKRRYSKNGEWRRGRAAEIDGASQWLLMRKKFGKHRLAMVSLFVLAGLYLVAIFADFVAPFDPQ